MKDNIPRIELDTAKYSDFMKENKVYIWKRTIDGIEQLATYAELTEVPVLIIEGGDLDKPKEFIIKRNQISDSHLDKALKIMETNEEYEYCTKIINIKNDKRGKK